MGDEEVLINIGKRLTLLRKRAGYTSYETFAFDHGIARQQYWRLEVGGNMTIKSLLKVLAVHKMSLEEFFKIDPEGE